VRAILNRGGKLLTGTILPSDVLDFIESEEITRLRLVPQRVEEQPCVCITTNVRCSHTWIMEGCRISVVGHESFSGDSARRNRVSWPNPYTAFTLPGTASCDGPLQ
jgi:hypothetical protein